MKLVPPGYPYFTPPPMESMARAGPNSPQWWSDTGPSWNPATGLDIHGNYGGPIGTSGPMDAWGGPRGDAQNIANGWGFMNPAGQPAPQFSGGQNNAATVEPSQARPAPQFSGGQNNAATGSSTALPPQIGQQPFGNSGIGSLGGGGQTNVSLNLQGSATMNPQGANQNRGYPGMNFASAQQQDQSRGTMMFAEGGPAQQVTQFQPTYSPAQQGIGSLQPYQAPNVPAMESSPTDYNQSPQYAPTQQYQMNGFSESPMFQPTGSGGMTNYQPRQQQAQTYQPPNMTMSPGIAEYIANMNNIKPPRTNVPITPPAPVAAPVVANTTSPTIYDPAMQTYSANPAVTTAANPVATTAGTDPNDTGSWGLLSGSGEDAHYGYTGPGGATNGQWVGGGFDDNGGREPGVWTPFGSTDDSSWDEKEGGLIHAYARGGSTPQGIASLGRGKDTMLVHMTPGEVHGLQRLAMRHGGSLTINPQTGLPEAGILSSLLPIALGFALGPAGLGMSSLAAAATVGGIGALATGSLAKGLQYGFGSYGGAGLGEGLSSMGAEQVDKLVAPEVNASAELAGKNAYQQQLAAQTALQTDATGTTFDLQGQPQAILNPPAPPPSPPTFSQTPEQFAELSRQRAIENVGDTLMPEAGSPASQALARSPAGNALEGFKQLGTKEGLKTLGGKLGFSGVASLAAPLISSALTPAATALPANKPSPYYKTSYNPPKYNPATGAYEPASYGPGSYYTNPTQYAAEGGTVGYARGGTPDFYPLTGDKVDMSAAPGRLGGRGEKPQYSRDMYGDDSGAGINDNKAGKGPYSDSAGVGIHTNTPSGVEGLFAKTSATTLAKYKNAKNAAMQAAAIKELRKRASAVDDYGIEETTSAAQGGLMGLNTYAAGGKLLRGPGDGMSDSIPAVIQGANPQRAALADGEFVMPADVVSHLGNGSTEAGSKRLYAMMDRVRKARTGNPKQGKQINPDRFMLA